MKAMIFFLFLATTCLGQTTHGFIITGNSYCQGDSATPALSTSQVGSNQQLQSGSLSSLSTSSGNPESPQYGMVNQITSESAGFTGIVLGLPNCASGSGYTTFGPSGPAANSGATDGTYNASNTTDYNNNVTGISTVNGLASGYVVNAVDVMEGGTEYDVSATVTHYENMLAGWQSSYQTAAQSATGQSSAVPMFIDQFSNFQQGECNTFQPTLCSGGTALGVLEAQWKAERDYFGTLYLVTPRYPYPYQSDGGHFINSGFLNYAEMYGKAMKKVIVDGGKWIPLVPRTITLSGNTITLRLWVPSGSVTIDTTTVVDATGRVGNWPYATVRLKRYRGFEWWDDSCVLGGVAPAGDCPTYITGVSVASSDTLTLTLNQAPTGTAGSQRLRYAFTGNANIAVNGGCNNSGVIATANDGLSSTAPAMICGNIRDSDSTTPQNGSVPNLYDWLITFSEAPGFDWEPWGPPVSLSGAILSGGSIQ